METARDGRILPRHAGPAAGAYHLGAGLGAARPSRLPAFLFDSGKGSTIAFFYYIGTERDEKYAPDASHFSTATHTAWSVDTEEELMAWKEALEAKGVFVSPYTRHEIIESSIFKIRTAIRSRLLAVCVTLTALMPMMLR